MDSRKASENSEDDLEPALKRRKMPPVCTELFRDDEATHGASVVRLADGTGSPLAERLSAAEQECAALAEHLTSTEQERAALSERLQVAELERRKAVADAEAARREHAAAMAFLSDCVAEIHRLSFARSVASPDAALRVLHRLDPLLPAFVRERAAAPNTTTPPETLLGAVLDWLARGPEVSPQEAGDGSSCSDHDMRSALCAALRKVLDSAAESCASILREDNEPCAPPSPHARLAVPLEQQPAVIERPDSQAAWDADLAALESLLCPPAAEQ